MENFCFLDERDYELIYFKDFDSSMNELLSCSKNKRLLHFGNTKITVDILTYMLKLLRISIRQGFEVIYIIENKASIEDKNVLDTRKYFKIFSSIERYNEVKVFAGFEVKLYDDNLTIRTLLKNELVDNGFGVKERNGLNFFKKQHDSKSNSIYVIDFYGFKEEKIEEIKKIKNINPDSTVILLVAEEDIDEALKTMKYGVDRVIKRPLNIVEVVEIIKFLAISANLKSENKRLVAEVFSRENEISKLYEAVNEELAIASDIQKSMMPKNNMNFNNYNISYVFNPSRSIGGDFYDFIPINDHSFAVVFADISGHGIPAALLSSMMKVLIRSVDLEGMSASELISNMNEQIVDLFPKGKFVSLFYILVDTNKNTATYCKASQESALLYKDGCDEVEELDTQGQLLGIFSKKIFPQMYFEEKTIDISLHDKILLYTDGIVEEMKDNEEYYGLDRLKEKLKTLSLEEIVEDLKQFTGASVFNDDISLLKIERVQ